MKKFLLIVFSLLLVLISVVVITVAVANEPLPEGEEGPKAEELVDKMLEALNDDAYQQLDVIKWSFPRGHHFVWNKAQDSVEVTWSDYRVLFKTKTLDGQAYQNEQELSGEDKQKALDQAWALFANDSFWLVAPFKVRDPGTSRKYVETERGPGILVSYSSGGVTPGDSYLWILGEDYKPIAWKLWTQILPLQGIEFSWHGWEQHDGVWLAPLHQGPGPVSVDLKNVEVE
mgnify:FL=1